VSDRHFESGKTVCELLKYLRHKFETLLVLFGVVVFCGRNLLGSCHQNTKKVPEVPPRRHSSTRVSNVLVRTFFHSTPRLRYREVSKCLILCSSHPTMP
jgi:hypothetical protein